MKRIYSKLRPALLVALAAALMLTALAGCGGSAKKGPNEKEIKKALEETDINIFVIDGQPEEMEVKSLDVTLQDTEDGWSEVLAEVVFENDHYMAETEMELYFSHYDKGGWVLEGGDFTDIALSLKKSPYDKKALTSMLEETLTHCKVSDIDTKKEKDGTFVQTFDFSGTVEEGCFPTEIAGNFTLTFENGAWYKHCEIEEMETDWHSLLGTWRYAADSQTIGPWFYDDTLIELDITDITQIGQKEVVLTYGGKTYLSYEDSGRTYTEVDESFTDVVKTVTSKMKTIPLLTCPLEVPCSLTVYLPWLYGSNVVVTVHAVDGVFVAEEFNYETVYLEKVK